MSNLISNYMTFIPKNALEEALVAAIEDPEARLNFYRTLLGSFIYVIPANDVSELKIENNKLEKEANIILMPIVRNNLNLIPFYSSPEIIAQSIYGKFKYIALNAITFLEMTKGNALVLNPATVGKEFTPQEITNLLDGSIFEVEKSYVVDAGQEILIGQPDQYPHELVSALIMLFKKIKTIKKAYLAHCFISKKSTEPILLLCIDLTDYKKWDKVIKNIYDEVAVGFYSEYKTINCIKYRDTGNNFDYFRKEIKPFYNRNLLFSPYYIDKVRL